MKEKNLQSNGWVLSALLAYLLLFLCVGSSTAQVNLQLTSSAPSTPRLSGNVFPVRFQYRCASTVQAAAQARLEVSIPASLKFSSVLNSPHIQDSGFDPVTRIAWFEFIDPLAAGTTGEVAVRVYFQNGVTPDGTVANLTGVFSAQAATSVSSTAAVTSEAISRLDVSKYVLGQPGIGNETVYGITICNGEHNEVETGTLNLGTLTVEDALPATATFVKFDPHTSGILSSNYDAGTHTANWTLSGLSSGECRWVRVVVRYDAPANSVGQTISNTVSVTSTPVGEAPVTETDAVSHVLNAFSQSMNIDKKVNNSTRFPGGYSSYDISLYNSGTEVLNDLMVTDVIPYETEVFRISVGEYNDATAVSPQYVTLQYQTNLNPTWQTYAGSPMNGWDGRDVELSELGLTFGGAEYLTQIRFEYGDRSNTFDSYNDITLSYRVRNGTPPGTITNCVTTSSSTPGATMNSDCVNFEVLAPLTGPAVYIHFERVSGSSSLFAVGDEVEFNCYIHNQSVAGAAMDDVMGIIYFPKGSTYVPGSVVVNRQDGLVGSPVLEYVENFDGNDNNILRIKWSGPSGDLPIDGMLNFNFRALINNSAIAGTDAIEFRAATSCLNTLSQCTNEYEVDTQDLDGDANTTEDICYREESISVSNFVAISSELSVKGSLDSDYSSFPAQGETLPGGLADYRLTVVNEGNVNLRDFTFLDIFPQVGDVGIIDPQARNSAWRPNLVGPVAAPTGVVVYYSTASNPCRAADGFLASDPPGCQTANWTIVPPADITSVSSIKVEFGSVLIAPNDTLIFEWPMRTPTDVLSQPGVNTGDLAYNSVGFIATVDGSGSPLLPSEPLKTGLEILSLVPGVIGDRVWSDTNGDGIQDLGESGVNNVRVELYEDNGDGIANVDDDTYLGFTITAGDGNYLFPNLSTGDFFVFFSKPPTYTLVPEKQGSDPTIDSDGISYYANGQIGAITEIVSVTNTQFEFTIDLGLEPSGLGAIGDYVWNDVNGDGIQDEGVAAGINGVNVNLLSNTGVLLRSTQTKPNVYGNPGYYSFDNISPGSYMLDVQIPTSATMSAQGQGASVEADSDGDPSNSGRTSLIAIVANSYTSNIDFALQLSGTEQCDNAIDDDGDGLVDCEDPDCTGSLLCAPRFACDNTLYQTLAVSGDYWLYRVDINPVALVPLVNLTAEGATGDLNSTILNPRDGYMYTVEMYAPFRTYRITGDLNVVYLGDLTVPSGIGGFNAGAVDRNGNWLVRDWMGLFYNIDINTLVTTFACDFSASIPFGNVGDLDYNTVDGNYYGAMDNSTSLFRYDFSTCSRTEVTLSRTIPTALGAFWVSAKGVGYGYENGTGTLVQIDLQTGQVDDIGTGGMTSQTDGCSCQGVKLEKDALVRTITKGDVNTYEFTVYNRYFTNLPGATFIDELPVGATWASAPYDITGGLSFGSATGIGTRSMSVPMTNVPQIMTSFKIDYEVDPTYSGVHPMPNQAGMSNLPIGIGATIPSDDPTTATINDPTLVHFYEHCTNGIDDDVDGQTDCLDDECPSANAALRINPN